MSFRSTANFAGLAYTRWLCRREYRRQTFRRLNERPVEYAFLFRQVARHQPRSVLDVGTGTTALPHLLRTCGTVVTAIDSMRAFWFAGEANRHWHVIHDDILATRLTEQFDLVTCVSVLEHISEHQKAVASMLRLVAPGGHLLVTAPYHERRYCPNVYELPGSELQGQALPPYATQAFSRGELNTWLAAGSRLIEQEYWQFYDGEYWAVGHRLPVPRQVGPHDLHQIGCMLLQKA